MADTFTSKYGLTKPGNLDAGGAGLWGPKLNTDFDLIDGEIWLPRLPFNAPTIGATTTFDLSLARIFALTVTQITTFAFSNVPVVGGSNFSTRIRIILTNGAAFAVTWPASVTWLSGTAPTLKASGVDEIELVTKDAGTNWYAALRGATTFQIGTSTSLAKPSLVLYQLASATTTSTGDNTLGSFTLPANALAVNNQQLRFTGYALSGAGGGTFKIKFGGSTIHTVNLGASETTYGTVTLLRTGATTQSYDRFWWQSLDTVPRIGFAGSALETLSGTVNCLFTGGSTVGGQTFTGRNFLIELLAV